MKMVYKHFNITSTYKGNKCWNADDKMKNYNNHTVTVYNTVTKKRTSFDFWSSIMNPEISTEQELAFAFYCFLSDGQGARYGFDNFCMEFGYDNDSMKAYHTFKACEKSMQKAERIGIDEDFCIEMLNDLQEKYEC